MRIVSKFTRGIISKAIKMVIRKKTGYNIDIQLNEAITTINDGKTHLHLDVDAELDIICFCCIHGAKKKRHHIFNVCWFFF